MIILDTNVISEMQKPEPAPKVIAWLDTLDQTTVYITAITVAELQFGVNRMPAGKRRTMLEQSIDKVIKLDFDRRILPFDAEAAAIFGRITAEAENNGRSVSFADGAIGAIARSHNNCSVATRDVAPFAALGIDTLNPWSDQE